MHRHSFRLHIFAALLTCLPAATALADTVDPASLCPSDLMSRPVTVAVTPNPSVAGQPPLVCALSFVFDTHVDAAVDGQHVVVTIFDNGFSWGPNPPIVSTKRLPALPAGHYSLDVIVSTDTPWTDDPYPYSLATAVPFDIAGGPPPVVNVPIPALDGAGLFAGVALLGLAGALRRRSGPV